MPLEGENSISLRLADYDEQWLGKICRPIVELSEQAFAGNEAYYVKA